MASKGRASRGDREFVLRQVGPIRLQERRKGPRASPEVLLVSEAAAPRPGERAADLGAAHGVLGLLLLAVEPGLTEVLAVEQEPVLADLAQRNAKDLGVSDRFRVECRNLADMAKPGAPRPAGYRSYDIVLANPPFYPEGWGTPSPDPIAHAASHELKGDLKLFLGAASALLAPQGRLVLVWGTERLAEALVALSDHGLGVERLLLARHRSRDRMHRVVLTARRGGSGLRAEVRDLDYKAFRDGEAWA